MSVQNVIALHLNQPEEFVWIEMILICIIAMLIWVNPGCEVTAAASNFLSKFFFPAGGPFFVS